MYVTQKLNVANFERWLKLVKTGKLPLVSDPSIIKYFANKAKQIKLLVSHPYN